MLINNNNYYNKSLSTETNKVQEQETKEEKGAQKETSQEEAKSEQQSNSTLKSPDEVMNFLSMNYAAVNVTNKAEENQEIQVVKKIIDEKVYADRTVTISVDEQGGQLKETVYKSGKKISEYKDTSGAQSYLQENADGSLITWIKNEKQQYTSQIRENSKGVKTYERYSPEGTSGGNWTISRSNDGKVTSATMQIMVGGKKVSLGNVKDFLGSKALDAEMLAELQDYAAEMTGGKYPNAKQLKEIKSQLKVLTTEAEPATKKPTWNKETGELTFVGGKTVKLKDASVVIKDDKISVITDAFSEDCVVRDYSYEGEFLQAVKVEYSLGSGPDDKVTVGDFTITLGGTIDNASHLSASEWQEVIDLGNKLKGIDGLNIIDAEDLSEILKAKIKDMLNIKNTSADAPTVKNNILTFKNGKTLDLKSNYVNDLFITKDKVYTIDSSGRIIKAYDFKGQLLQEVSIQEGHYSSFNYLNDQKSNFYMLDGNSTGKTNACLVENNREVAIVRYHQDSISLSLDDGNKFIVLSPVGGLSQDCEELTVGDLQEVIAYGKELVASGKTGEDLIDALKTRIEAKLTAIEKTPAAVLDEPVYDEKTGIVTFANGETLDVTTLLRNGETIKKVSIGKKQIGRIIDTELVAIEVQPPAYTRSDGSVGYLGGDVYFYNYEGQFVFLLSAN